MLNSYKWNVWKLKPTFLTIIHFDVYYNSILNYLDSYILFIYCKSRNFSEDWHLFLSYVMHDVIQDTRENNGQRCYKKYKNRRLK